jgi:ethanolamine transporter EutH
MKMEQNAWLSLVTFLQGFLLVFVGSVTIELSKPIKNQLAITGFIALAIAGIFPIAIIYRKVFKKLTKRKK